MFDRNALLRKLHATVRQQGLDKDTYRARLELVTGKRSAADLDHAELEAAVASFAGSHSTAQHDYQRKVKAFWIACWNLGALERGDDAALDAFVARQTGKQRLTFLTSAEANSVTEALKKIAARNGFVSPPSDRGGVEARRALLLAQWRKLGTLGADINPCPDRASELRGLDLHLSREHLGRLGTLADMSRKQLDDAARAFGRQIRHEQEMIARKAGSA